MTDRRVAWGARGLAVAALAFLAPEARAQSLGADVQLASRYMWRGITRSQVWVAQPALSLTSPEVCLESHSLCGNVSGGAWANGQMQGAWPDELGDLAVRKRGFSEVDLWAEGAVRSEGLEFAAGGVRYLYPASDPGALWRLLTWDDDPWVEVLPLHAVRGGYLWRVRWSPHPQPTAPLRFVLEPRADDTSAPASGPLPENCFAQSPGR